MNAMLASSSQWYDHFRGALYPLDLERCSQAVENKKDVSPLVQISADYIVRDSTMTLQAARILPKELIVVLMKQALARNRDRSVNVLLTQWPHQTLSIKKFAPYIFSDLRLLHDHLAVTQVAKQGLRYTTCVAHNFLEILKGSDTSCLKYIDMTGYPTAEVIAYYLATHTMLAHNESRQNMMIQKYERAVQLLPADEAQGRLERFTADRTIPDDQFVVKLDVFLTSEHAMYEVCKALKISSYKVSTLKIIVEKLDVTCLGAKKVKILLEQLRTENLLGLRLKYNGIGSEEFMDLCPVVSTFTQITSLDLSCNCINVFQNDLACDKMAQLFADLPLLVRLDLSNNRLKTKLRRVLSNVVKPLQFLRLAGCGLTLKDLTYLQDSHHTKALRELDVSENALFHDVDILCQLLRNVRQQICVLEIEDSGLTDSYTEALITSSSFKQLTSLIYLNISGNSMRESTLCMVCEEVAGLAGLQYLHLSYPRECFILDQLDDQDRLMAEASHRLDEHMASRRRQHQLQAVPKLVLSNMDQEMNSI